MAFIPMVSVWSIFDLAFGVDGCCDDGMEEMGRIYGGLVHDDI